jgi:membrane protein DedA with SNARE-associated domain
MDGTAARFAFENWDGSSIWSGDVTLVGHGGSLQLESVSLVKDTTVSIASAIYVVPA